MQTIAVAVVLNLITILTLSISVFIALHKSVRATIVKLSALILSCILGYFLTPLISNAIYKIKGMQELLTTLCISKGSINSCLFALQFVIAYIMVVIICEIVHYTLLSKMKKKVLKTIKSKRAMSISPFEEIKNKFKEVRTFNLRYKEDIKSQNKFVRHLLGLLVAVLCSYVIILPYNYISQDINNKKGESHNYLTQGYEYTLNGVVGDGISDFLIGND